MLDKQQPDQPDPGELLEKLSRADKKNLSGAVKKVDGLTEEEQAASKRAQDDKLSEALNKSIQDFSRPLVPDAALPPTSV